MERIFRPTPVALCALLFCAFIYALALPEEFTANSLEGNGAALPETTIATSTDPIVEVATTTEGALIPSDIVVATTTPATDEQPLAPDISLSTNIAPLGDILPEAIPMTPQDCHDAGSRTFFHNPGECMRTLHAQ